MKTAHPILIVLFGEDPKSRRMLGYWAMTAVLYVLCNTVLWFEEWIGAVPVRSAIGLTVFIHAGLFPFYGLIRFRERLGLTPAQLAAAQGCHAILGVISAYAIVPPVRGSILILLLVVLIFCAFALSPRRSLQISLLTILLLGITMLWLAIHQPWLYPPAEEVVHFLLASSMLIVVSCLTGQFNYMRQRHKSQKAELSKMLAHIQSLATHDELTALPNRRYLKEILDQQEKRHRSGDKTLSLALLDIDYFKQVNDSYGHEVGDDMLHSFARQLQSLLRATDIVGRWGGEEFLVLLPNTDQEKAIDVLERVRSNLREISVRQTDKTLSITFSGGITTLLPQETVFDAITRADLAMFYAKTEGRNMLRIYRPEMEKAKRAYSTLKADLQQAVREQGLMLYYQPQVHSDNSIKGAEVLLRWRHPTRGLVSPVEFVPLAEETGLIIPIGQWVIAVACKQLAKWAANEDLKHLTLSVNVSAKHLRQPEFVNQVLAEVHNHKVDPTKLRLELTESMLIDDITSTVQKMNRLKAEGIGFSLDDFGTGYSSLYYLKQLPVNELKIDRSFVKDMLVDANDAAIARTVIALAGSLGFGVIAEGVETIEQKEFLVAEGCRDFQGFLYSPAVPLNEFEAFAARRGIAFREEMV